MPCIMETRRIFGMTNTYFFTGFPGFLATSLIKQLIREDHSIKQIYVLVLPGLVKKAEKEIENIMRESDADVFTIVPGDITQKDLALTNDINNVIQEEVTHVFHLAAIYDLAVPKDIAYNVNVIGTANINQWLLHFKTLKRYTYFSTAYVSGKREGVILETELEMNQSFKNHYEHTKYEAEILVRDMLEQIPTTIIRPGIVKGNSKTGETIKFDGPYFVLNFLEKLRFLPSIPYLGEGKVEGNFVPVDYILDATLYLSHSEKGVGKTYHLTDPKPYLIKDVYKMLMEAYLGKKPRGRMPLSLAKSALSLSPMRKWLGVEKEALDYFTLDAHYDCTQAEADLRGSGISCADFKETVSSMTEFYRDHKDDQEKHIKII